MSEGKHTALTGIAAGMQWTPQGWNVDPQARIVYELKDGRCLLRGAATSTEMELWAIRASLVEALEAMLSVVGRVAPDVYAKAEAALRLAKEGL